MPHIYKKGSFWYVVEESYRDIQKGIGIYKGIKVKGFTVRTAWLRYLREFNLKKQREWGRINR